MQNHGTIITQCPNCDTQFKVTNGQLKVAAGQVRCGSCLVVFKATEHQVKAELKPPEAKPRTPTADPRRKPETTAPAPKPASQPKAQLQAQAQPQTNHQPEPAEVASAQVRALNISSSQRTEKTDTTDLIKTVVATDVPTLTIETEAVLLTRTEQKKPSSARWLIGSLLAILLIATQLLWFKRNQLYWDTSFQPLYSSICQLIDCDIALRSDISKIANRSINITPHATVSDAITINLVLVNEANFQQPFPALNIQFSDLKGRDVAARVFQPSNYLDLEIVDPKSMLSQQPYQISIEVMSPGLRGINYQVELLAPAL